MERYYRLFCKIRQFFLTSEFEGGNVVRHNARVKNSKIGYGTYIGKECDIKDCNIGKFCSIGQRVKTIIGNHPSRGFISTHPSFFSIKKQSGFTFVNEDKFLESFKGYKGKSIKIGNDVWVGSDVKILDGIKIGDGAIIAAGAVVNKNIEPYSIYGGIPAKKIKDRYSKEEKDILLKFKWWDKDLNWIARNSEKFSDEKEFFKLIKEKA